jgi:protein involved in polysaccharide export with SLBB domain
MRTAVAIALAATFVVGCAAPQKQHRTRTQQQPSRPVTVRRVEPVRPAPAPAPYTAPARVDTRPVAPVAPPAVAPPPPSPPASLARGSTGSSASHLAPQLDPSIYRLAAGDVVRIDVFNEPELSLSAAVETSGSLTYPLLGQVPAAGLNVRQLEVRLADGLKAGYLVNPDVRVNIAQYRPIYITGQVRRVGSYPYTIGLTVERALTMAGGINEFGSTSKVYVQHENTSDDTRVKVDLDVPVLPGDTILVEERLF